MIKIHIMDGPPLRTNGFLVVGNNGHAAAIDPAAKASLFIQELQKHNAVLTHILLTHGHYDHIGSVSELRRLYGAKVYINKEDEALSRFSADEYYQENQSITVDDAVFSAIFTPGHTRGSTCLRCGNWLFSGDTLFAGDIGRTDLPGGNYEMMEQSLKKLLKMVPDNPEVFPGHASFTTMEKERKDNMYLRNAEIDASL